MHLLATDVYARKYSAIVLGASSVGARGTFAEPVNQLMSRATCLSLTIGRLGRHTASHVGRSHDVVIKDVDSGKVFQTMADTTYKQHWTLVFAPSASVA
jgi:hypothetical protein